MILVMFILTPFTTSPSLSLFFHYRVAQCRLMTLAVIHGLNPNQKLRSILEGCANLRSLWSPDFDSHHRFAETFSQPDAVYLRFTHRLQSSAKVLHWLRCSWGSFIGNTADFESFYNFKMTNWYRRSSRYDTGRITTTCSFGVQSLCSLDEVTFEPWSWLSSKNGNPSSIFRLFANSTILEKAF